MTRWVCVALLLSLGMLPEAKAQSMDGVGAGDEPRVFAIQERKFRLGHEFQLGLGVLPMDAFYVGLMPTASYTYHFSDFWAWEIANAGYSVNFNSGLKRKLREDFRLEPTQGGGTRIEFVGTTNLVAKPLYGKLALFNSSVVHSETFASAGGGLVVKGGTPLFALAFGLGFRFWSTQGVSFRVDVRDMLLFARWVPENVLVLTFSASLNVFDNDAAQEPVLAGATP